MVEKLNWSKAKTILIFAFIITNLILGLVILKENNREISTIKQSFIEDVMQILEKKDIHLDTKIPNQIPSLKTLTVEYEMISPSELNDRFFSGNGEVELEEGIVNINSANEKIILENDKILNYKNERQSNGVESLNIKTGEDIVFNFLSERGYETSDMKVLNGSVIDDIYRMEFSKIYNEKYIEVSYTVATLDETGVLSLKRLWLNPIIEGENPIYISTAPKAILDLISNQSVYGKTIVDISLCYYLNSEDNIYVESPNLTREGKAMPAWRVIFDDGSKIIIDNY